MAKFNNTAPDWVAEGVEPPEELKITGFKVDYRPPADYFNWFWSKVSSCIAELQNNSAGYMPNYDVTDGTYHGEIFNDYEMNEAGAYAHAQNYQCKATGVYSHAGGQTTNATGNCAFTHGYDVTAAAYNFVIGKKSKSPTAASETTNTGDLFTVGNGLSGGARSNAFRITASGQVLGTQAYAATGADFAELFEFEDGNPNNEDRRGLFVTLVGEKIRLATADDDYILGVVSAAPTIIGDACTDDWQGKYVTDIFGARVLENGAFKLTDDFDEEKDENYVSRLERPEWAAIGLVGKLVVVDDGTCQVNGYCYPLENGIATASDKGYRVMARIDKNHVKVVLK